MTSSYTTDISHDGRTYTVTIPDLELGRCERCGEMVLPGAASERITATFRQQLGYLTPEQVREKRKSLGLTQKELAKLIGSADATLSRLETGTQIQSRAMDRLLRLFFAFDNVRRALADEKNLARLGLEVQAEAGMQIVPQNEAKKTGDDDSSSSSWVNRVREYFPHVPDAEAAVSRARAFQIAPGVN